MPAFGPPPPLPCTPAAWERDEERPESLGSVVSAEYPVRVHWTRDGDQDRADVVLEAVETAWRVQVDELGFVAPVLPDDADGPELDVYLADLAEGEGWAWAPVQEDATPGDEFLGAPAYVAFDRDLPEEWLASYAVHEFQHVLQYATDFSEPGVNVWEATAVAAQHWTLGNEGRWWADVADFQAEPWAPVLWGDGYGLRDRFATPGSFYEYGAGLWVLALDPGDGSFGPALWRELARAGHDGDDVAAAVAAASGLDLRQAMDRIAERRWTGQGIPAWVEHGVAPTPMAELTGADLPWSRWAELGVSGQAFVRVTDVGELNFDAWGSTFAESGYVAFQDGLDVVVAATRLPVDGEAYDAAADDPWLTDRMALRLWLPDQEPADLPGEGCSCATGGGSSTLLLPLFLGLRRRR